MSRSSELYSCSKALTPGGVSSPVRAFSPNPLFISRGQGSRIFDVDGKEYVDLCMAYGPLIAGHACPDVIDSVKDAVTLGTVYGAPSEPELRLIEEIIRRMPSCDMVRLACSGTEATMHAIRLARGYTGKNGIVKMNGGFHGAHDAVLVAAGSGSARGVPGSAGVPADAVRNTYSVEYNDAGAFGFRIRRQRREHGRRRRLEWRNHGELCAFPKRPRNELFHHRHLQFRNKNHHPEPVRSMVRRCN